MEICSAVYDVITYYVSLKAKIAFQFIFNSIMVSSVSVGNNIAECHESRMAFTYIMAAAHFVQSNLTIGMLCCWDAAQVTYA